jgi:hypothetical protein
LNVNENPQTILLADDTSVIVSSQNNAVLGNNLKSVFTSAMKWFKANLLSLNLDKTYCMEFRPKYIINSEIQIKHNNKIIVSTTKLKFLGLVLHIDMLATKLNKAFLHCKSNQTFLIIKLPKDNLSCVFSFNYNIRTNILGSLFPQFEYF